MHSPENSGNSSFSKWKDKIPGGKKTYTFSQEYEPRRWSLMLWNNINEH